MWLRWAVLSADNSSSRERGDELSLTALLSEVVLPVLAILTPQGELESVAVRRTGNDEPDPGSHIVQLRLVGEPFSWFAHVPGQVDEDYGQMRTRLASELQDFIAESKFAWAELRPWPSETPPSSTRRPQTP
jgi:hypothetical protein